MSTKVFLNVPFDAKYKDLFLALVTGVVGHGATPRCVLELPSSSSRMVRLKRLIRQCPISFNDLSRVQLSFVAGHGRVPRFNMPFELGMAVMTGNDIFLLEEKPHRIGVTLNDMNGWDTIVHQNNAEVLLARVSDALQPRRGRPPQFQRLRNAFRRVRSAAHAHLGSTPADLYTRTTYKVIVSAAVAECQREGLV